MTKVRESILFSTLFTILLFALAFSFASKGMAQGKGVVTFTFSINDYVKGKQTNLWIPFPKTDADQTIDNVYSEGNEDTKGVYEDSKTGASYLYVEWKNPQEVPTLTFSFHVDSHFTKGKPLVDGGNSIPDEIKAYLAESSYTPISSPEITKYVKEATADKKTLLEKARAVYDWTIKNTHRDPDIKGCGTGDPIETLTKASGGGKCADISAVFVTMARAAGIPARKVYSLRTRGKSGNITGDYHCWAEFYLPGTGWVKADPADVRKTMLVQKIGENDKRVAEVAESFWNGDDLFRIVLGRAESGLIFGQKQKGEAVDYFMYPYAEVDGKPLDYFSPKTFVYSVSFEPDNKPTHAGASCCE